MSWRRISSPQSSALNSGCASRKARMMFLVFRGEQADSRVNQAPAGFDQARRALRIAAA